MQAWALLAAPRGNARAQWPESNSATEMMENPLFSVNSDTATWLSPRAKTWAKDVLLAFLCGLVLFLLLLPCLQSSPSPPPGKKHFTKHQVHKRGHRNMRKKSGASKACRACQKKDKESQDVAFFLSIHCKGSSMGAEGDITPHPFWNKEGKPDPLPSPRQLSYPKFLWELMEQKCSQLFWGLPSLLCESLVATAWVSKKPSTPTRRRTVLFKGVTSTIPAQPVVEEPPQLSETQPLPQDVPQPKPVTQTLPSVAKVQTPAPIPCSPPDKPPTSPSQVGTCKATCSTRPKAHWFVPIEKERLDWPLQNQMKWKKVLASKLRKGEEGISPPTPNLPEGSQSPQTPQTPGSPSLLEEDSESPKLQGHVEPQSPARPIKNEKRQDPLFRFPAAQELMQPRGKFPWPTGHRAEDKPGPPPRSALTFESNRGELRKEPTCSRRPSKKSPVVFKQDHPRQGLEQDPGRVLESLPWRSGSTLEKGLEDKDGSRSGLRRPGKSHLGIPKSKDKKNLETLLQIHLGRKGEQIDRGMIPVRVRRSWLVADQAYPKSSINVEPMKPSGWKGRLAGMNTSRVLPFFDLKTRQMLKTDVIRSQETPRWGPHLQAWDPVSHSRREAPASPLLQPAFPSSASQDPRANSFATVAKFLEDLPQKCPGQKAMTSMPLDTVQSPFPALSSAELQRVQRGPLSSSGPGSSEAHPTPQEGSLCSQPHTFRFLGRTQQGSAVLRPESESLAPHPSPAVAVHEPQGKQEVGTSGDVCCSVTLLEIKVGPPSSVTKETKGTVEVEKAGSAWQVTVNTSKMEKPQVFHVGPGSSGALESRESPFPCITPSPQEPPGVLGLKAPAVTDGSSKVEVKSEKQPQEPAASILPDSQAAVLPTTASQPTQACVPSSQSVTQADPQGLCDQSKWGEHSQGQQEPSEKVPLLQVKVRRRDHSAMSTPAEKTVVFEEPMEEEQEDLPAEVTPSIPWGLSPPAPVIEIEDMETMFCPHLQDMEEKGPAPQERNIKKRLRHFLHSLTPKMKSRGQVESQQRGMAPPARVQIQPAMESKGAEAQTLVVAIGKILVDKLGLWHGSGPSGSPWYEEKSQAVLGRYSHYYSNPWEPEPSRVKRGMGRCQHTSPKGHSHPGRWTTDRDSHQDFVPRQPVSPASSSQHRIYVAVASRHVYHYPAHRLQKGVLSG